MRHFMSNGKGRTIN